MNVIKTSQADSLISANMMVLIFFGIIVFTIAILLLKKIYFYVKYRKTYYIFPKIDTKGIANIAMVIAISVAVILLLTVLTAGLLGVMFRVYPGWRVTIEGILIKIGGLLFGPIIGIFIGAMTDILTVTLTSGMFHYGFFVVSIAYGFFAGLIRTLINTSKKNTFLLTIFSTILIFVVTVLISLYINFFPLIDGKYEVTVFGSTLYVSKYIIMGIVICFQSICLLTLWLSLIFLDRKNFIYYSLKTKIFFQYDLKQKIGCWFLRRKISCQYFANRCNVVNAKSLIQQKGEIIQMETFRKKYIQNDNSWFFYMAATILLISFGEPLVEIVIMPPFDSQLGGGMPIQYWIPMRTVMFIPVSIINFIIIFPVYKTVEPTLKYKYNDNIVEFKKRK